MTLFKLFSRSKKAAEVVVKPATLDEKESAYTDGFRAGYLKAFDTVMPLAQEGMEKVKEALRNEAYEKAIRGLAPAIDHKITEMKAYNLRDIYGILDKVEELQKQFNATDREGDRLKLSHQIQALKWVLDGDLLQTS